MHEMRDSENNHRDYGIARDKVRDVGFPLFEARDLGFQSKGRARFGIESTHEMPDPKNKLRD